MICYLRGIPQRCVKTGRVPLKFWSNVWPSRTEIINESGQISDLLMIGPIITKSVDEMLQCKRDVAHPCCGCSALRIGRWFNGCCTLFQRHYLAVRCNGTRLTRKLSLYLFLCELVKHEQCLEILPQKQSVSIDKYRSTNENYFSNVLNSSTNTAFKSTILYEFNHIIAFALLIWHLFTIIIHKIS